MERLEGSDVASWWGRGQVVRTRQGRKRARIVRWQGRNGGRMVKWQGGRCLALFKSGGDRG